MLCDQRLSEKGIHRVPLTPARGPGGGSRRPLYETVIDGERYIVWDTDSGGLRATSARCPHRPQRPTLHLRGILHDDTLLCTVHGNAYCITTGRCITAVGPDHPGRLTILSGWRDGDDAVLVDGEPAG